MAQTGLERRRETSTRHGTRAKLEGGVDKASKFRVLLEDGSMVNVARGAQDGSRSTDKTPKPK